MISILDQTLDFRNLGRCDWDSAVAEQEQAAEAVACGRSPGTVLFVEHEPVYTCGVRFRAGNFRLPYDPAAPSYCGVPVRRAYRGGELTYHGPGQLVVYPILRLPRGGHHLRRLIGFYQNVILAVLAELRIEGFARSDAIGVWTGRGKVASIGVGVRRGVTRNGFAINVSVDRRAFEPIVPCGRSEPVANLNDFFANPPAALPLCRTAGDPWGPLPKSGEGLPSLECGGLTPLCPARLDGPDRDGSGPPGPDLGFMRHDSPRQAGANEGGVKPPHSKGWPLSPDFGGSAGGPLRPRISIDEVRQLVEKHFIRLATERPPTTKENRP